MSKSLFIASLVASAAGAALGDDSASVLDTFPWAATVPGIDSPNTINGRVPEGTPGSPLSSRIISASTIGEEELTIAYRTFGLLEVELQFMSTGILERRVSTKER